MDLYGTDKTSRAVFLLLPFCLLLGACSGGQRRLDSIKSRIDGVERELSGDINSAPVKTLGRTRPVMEFDAAGEGMSTRYERPVEAEKRAEENALSKAVREAGVSVYSGFQNFMQETPSAGYEFIGRYLSVWSNSLVSYERAGPAECSFSGGIHRCKVKIRGKVYFKGGPDPSFELRAGLDKPAYFEGDPVTLRLRLSRDAYVTVLNCDEDGNVTLIFPNRLADDNFLPAGKDLEIPGESFFSLTAGLPAGRGESAEILHVIATKSRSLAEYGSAKEERSGDFISYPLGGVKDLALKLARFDRADWTAQVLFYSVKSGK